jgi:hypothetical protein
VGRAPGPEPVTGWQEVGLEHRLHDQLHCGHHHPVAHAWDAERPGGARLARLGDVDPPQRRRPVDPAPERGGEVIEEGCHPGRLNSLDGDPIHAGRPSVGSHLVPGPFEDVAAGDLVEQGMEAAMRLLLGAAIEHVLQGTDLVQAVGLRGGPSPHRALTGSLLQHDASMKQGSFPPAGLCCPRPSGGTTTPSDSLVAACHFPGPPVIGRLASRTRSPGPPRASPVPTTPFWPFHAPYAGGFLGTRSRLPGAVHGLRHWNAGSAPSWPARAGIPNDAAGFA